MKKIINGKMYDTETARKVAETEHSYRSQFDWYFEELYCKRTGEYFLAGEGHAASKYAKRCDTGGFGPGSAIIPLTYDQAIAWAEAAMSPDEYEKEFGPVSEDDTVRMQISLPADVADRIRKAAKAEGISVSECVGRRF